MTHALIAIEKKDELWSVMRLVDAETWAPVGNSLPMPVCDVTHAVRAEKILAQAAEDQSFELVPRGTVQDRMHLILNLALDKTITYVRAHALIAGEFFLGDTAPAAFDERATDTWLLTLTQAGDE